jgi:hypothetical protein
MPANIEIGFLILGGILLLLALLGGNFKLFGAEIADKISNPWLRVLGFCLSLGFFAMIIRPSLFLPTPTQVDTPTSPPATPTLNPTVAIPTASATAPALPTVQTGPLSMVVGLGGHLYREPSRAEGMVVGLIWPGDKVIRLGDEFETSYGRWIHIRVVQASPDRGEGAVPENTEGYARADLISP